MGGMAKSTSAERVAAMRARRAAVGIIEINVSLPQNLVAKVDGAARRAGVSRSRAAALLLALGIAAAKEGRR